MTEGTGPVERPPSAEPRRFLLAMLAVMLVVWAWSTVGRSGDETIDYSAFLSALRAGRVERVVVGPDEVVGTMKATDETAEETRFRAVRVEDPELVSALEAQGVDFVGAQPSRMITLLGAWLLPLIFFGGLIFLFTRRLRQGAGGLLGVGRSKARLVAEDSIGVDFGDVAGCDEAKAELVEVVDFLQRPARSERLGARIPKGVLLVGPPGTGKTLLARAVAGEAKVPFFELSGSDFIEMFVGVGAARVRDLFEQAKARAPCIVFVDELDAVGRRRGVHVSSTNDEREQTLNQLLVEMDGFEANQGVILLAATNRPDVLDPALLRPGRFDRRVVVDAPDREGRLAILRVHSRDRPLADDLDLERVARATPGFTGADLANAMNEASLLAARAGAEHVDQRHVEDAVERVVAGPERRSLRLGDDERRRIAFHESGHALVAWHGEHADPVYKLSIVPRGHAALGFTLQLPEDDQHLFTHSALLDRLAGFLGGRAAERLVFGEVSTGAADDLDRATQLARRMVTMYGMSEAVGPVHCGVRDPLRYLTANEEAIGQDCSEETARTIDRAVRGLLDDADKRATALLEREEMALRRVAERLLEVETIDADQFGALVDQRRHSTPKPTIGPA